MSRANLQDKSTAVSLFPFLAVLLCTMGSLLVVLVAVTRLSRSQAVERVTAEKAAQAAPDESDEDTRQKLQAAQKVQNELDDLRAKAEEKLREEQLRLSHIEDHMRRLQEQFESLLAAAAELAELQEDHTDDRDQAAREVARLQQLIEDTRKAIEEQKAELASKPRSYAIVPYKGSKGTSRRPIYIECRGDAVVLQPEGVQLRPEDFLPPLGPGNPLASAIRAASDYHARENPESQNAEPYPLILVRPQGIRFYYLVREAIESWDSDFGYELIDGDWELEFPPPNPQLAQTEFRAVSQARERTRMLAAAAPRAYGMVRAARGTGFRRGDSERGGGASGGGFGNGLGDASGVGSVVGDDEGGNSADEYATDGFSGREHGSGTNGGGGGFGDGGQPGTSGDANGSRLAGGTAEGSAAETEQLAADGESPNAGSDGANSEGPGGPPGEPGSQQAAATGSAAGASQGVAGGLPDAAGGPTAGLSSSGAAAGGSGSPSPSPGSAVGVDEESGPGVASFDYSFRRQPEGARGKNWGLRRASPDDVPIRRSIQIVVRQDRLAILPELSATGEPVVGGKEVLLRGSTQAAFDEFVTALRDTMREWGIAGQGLYWRPVLVLNVGPDGERRAGELEQFLHNSGMELRRASATAQHDEGTDSRATR